MGGIGRNLKKKAQAFGMKVIYHNRNKLEPRVANGAEYVEFDELLSRSDVLSLNLPLNSNTRHTISTREFEKMKRGIVIINTARGAIIDEEALVKALDSGKVWSCGLDVYESEPKIHPGLVANPNVMLLPHMGTWTVEVGILLHRSIRQITNSVQTQTKMENWNIGNVRAVLEKGALNNIVPEQADM